MKLFVLADLKMHHKSRKGVLQESFVSIRTNPKRSMLSMLITAPPCDSCHGLSGRLRAFFDTSQDLDKFLRIHDVIHGLT